MVKSTVGSIIPLLIILLQISCIREGLQECEDEYSITIKVVDAVTGKDITASGEVSHAKLFIFNEHEQFLYTISMDSLQIRQKIPVSIKLEKNSHNWISVWGNLGGNQQVTEITSSNTLDNSTVSIISENNENIHKGMDDLFFGILSVMKDPYNGTENREIVISRKNARIYITVRGLPSFYNAENYYFVIRLNNSGYDFRGTPVPHVIEIKQSGITLENNDFVSPPVFNLIHTNDKMEDYVMVYLYRKETGSRSGADILIASVNSDLNGNPIVLPSGQTTNLLIDLRQAVSVYVKTSPWDKIEQWVEW